MAPEGVDRSPDCNPTALEARVEALCEPVMRIVLQSRRHVGADGTILEPRFDRLFSCVVVRPEGIDPFRVNRIGAAAGGLTDRHQQRQP